MHNVDNHAIIQFLQSNQNQFFIPFAVYLKSGTSQLFTVSLSSQRVVLSLRKTNYQPGG